MSKRALVLGAAGFIGSHLVRDLLVEGWNVTGVVRSSSAREVGRRLCGVLQDVRLLEGDCADPDLLERAVVGVDAVLPFAGRSGATRSLTDPIGDLMANVVATEVLIEAVRRRNPDARIVVPGSRLQYGPVDRLPVDEGRPCRPVSPYGLHKLLAEQAFLFHHRVHDLRVTCLRISNPYGAFQDRPDAAFGVVGTFMRAASHGAPITLYSGGRQQRDYLHVADLTKLVLRLLDQPTAAGRIYNVGGPAPTTLREMAEAVIRTVGRGTLVEGPWPEHDARVETGDYVADITRARQELGWRPTISLDEGLRRTWASMAGELEALARPAPGSALPTAAR